MENIIITVGPNFTKPKDITGIEYIYRFNGSHISLMYQAIDSFREEMPDSKVLIDIPSNLRVKIKSGLKEYDDVTYLGDRDKELIEVANNCNVDYLGLSFVRDEGDVLEALELLDGNIKPIAKIETFSSLINISSILAEVDHILIDRGDLATAMGIEQVPKWQQYIVNEASGKKVFLATGFLGSMIDKPKPTIAEVNDLHDAIRSGVHGIQFSEETAVGMYSDKCIDIIESMLKNGV